MRGELNLSQYTLENVVFHLLHRRYVQPKTALINRVPHYPHSDLTRWYHQGHSRSRARVFKYYMARCRINLEILEAQELIARVWYNVSSH